MNYKIEGAIKKNKKSFIIAIILWLFIAIIIIPPVAFSILAATFKGGFDFDKFFSYYIQLIIHPFQAFKGLGMNQGFGVYVKTLIGFSFLYAIIFLIGFFKSAPKSEYADIEHGSSDWSQNGEQYQVLSKNKGIILAENNYLPVDKRGNVNVLVVGRIGFW